MLHVMRLHITSAASAALSHSADPTLHSFTLQTQQQMQQNMTKTDREQKGKTVTMPVKINK